MSQALNPKAVYTYLPLLQIETQSFLKRMLASPDKFHDNMRRYVFVRFSLISLTYCFRCYPGMPPR